WRLDGPAVHMDHADAIVLVVGDVESPAGGIERDPGRPVETRGESRTVEKAVEAGSGEVRVRACGCDRAEHALLVADRIEASVRIEREIDGRMRNGRQLHSGAAAGGDVAQRERRNLRGGPVGPAVEIAAGIEGDAHEPALTRR